MKVELFPILVGDIVNGYIDNGENGVFGFGGKLNIRPKYQREFVYKDKQRDAVIETITKNFPLNVMYWAKNDDETFELLDGQQRTISICQYVNGDFSINERCFHNLTDTEREQILNYPLMIYICDGNDKERLEWFRTINIAGEKLTEQELLNINYTGKWLEDAKKKFSKNACIATQIQNKYQLTNGSPIRQEQLEIALEWISKGKVAKYMAQHQHDNNANELWLYFSSVIEWVKVIFPKYRKEMKGLNWGKLYDEYNKNQYDVEELEKEINRLMADDDVTNKKGIFEYLLSNKSADKERLLSIRAFTDSQKRSAYEKQKGICPICGREFVIEDMQGDHIVEWSRGGKTTMDNLQMVCKSCHKELTRRMND